MSASLASNTGVIDSPRRRPDNTGFRFGAHVLPLRTHPRLGRSVMAGESEGVHAELRREKARLKLLLELTGQAVSNRELRDLIRSVMTSIRSAIDSDRVCIFLESPTGGVLDVYALESPSEAGSFKEGTPVPLAGTITSHVLRTGKPWVGTREQASAVFPGQLLLAEQFSAGCLLPLSGRNRVVGTLGLVRTEHNPYSPDEIGFLTLVSSQIALAVENGLAYEEIKRLKEQLQIENHLLQDELVQRSNYEEIIGDSSSLEKVLMAIEKVASTDSTVLITGETGTGKELVAHAIHRRSHRSSRPLIKVNLAAVPKELIASELFGHEKGAFTGAMQQRIGRFEAANGGTLFLDEIAELSPEMQVSLLRVLQEKEFERVGGNRTIKADVRVIAATNRELERQVAEGRFRSDLYYRLNVFPIEVPPLRERRDDIPVLVDYFAARVAARMGKRIRQIEKRSLAAMQGYWWPGNIRELQNIIERCVILSEGEVLRLEPGMLLSKTEETESPKIEASETRGAKGEIEAVLRQTRGRVYGPGGAAARLGVPASTLEYRIRSLKINKHQFR